MSEAKRKAEQVNTEYTARTYTPGIGPADFDRIDNLIAEGKTDEEIEDITGIFEETITEYRSGSWGDTTLAGDRKVNQQIHTDLPSHLSDKVVPQFKAARDKAETAAAEAAAAKAAEAAAKDTPPPPAKK